MSGAAETWNLLLVTVAAAFTQPSFVLFRELASAWVLCPGRHTVTRMILVADPEGRRAHDAYHRFLRAGAWSMPLLWRPLARHMVAALCPDSDVLLLDLDDTLFHKTGRKVEGAGSFRDAVRSTGRRVVYALGLNLVVLTLRVKAPWGGEPLGLPINLRLYRKGGPSHLELAKNMIEEVAAWFPDHRVKLACDGAYASLAGRGLPRTHVTSRMRRDAALYELPPPRKKGQRGRPAKKGPRLPTPEQIAGKTKKGWVRAVIDRRGKAAERLLLCRSVLWYQVCPDQPVLLVVVRDPSGVEHDDFFFSTDVTAAGDAVAGHYAGRWSIEDTYRNVKQFLGGEDPQCWKGHGPERAAALSCWIYAAVWTWYIATQGAKPSWPALPWYTAKKTPSFADALAALRRTLWRQRFFSRYNSRPLPQKTAATLIDILARAA